MYWLDIIIILWLGISLLSGVKLGFVYKFGVTVGFVFGLWFASRWTPGIALRVGDSPLMTAGIFLFLLVLVSKVFGGVAWLLNRAFRFVSIVPFLKTFNRVLGGVLGVLISAFIISSGLFVADVFSKNGVISERIDRSFLAPKLMKLSVFYSPLLSEKLELFWKTKK